MLSWSFIIVPAVVLFSWGRIVVSVFLWQRNQQMQLRRRVCVGKISIFWRLKPCGARSYGNFWDIAIMPRRQPHRGDEGVQAELTPGECLSSINCGSLLLGKKGKMEGFLSAQVVVRRA